MLVKVQNLGTLQTAETDLSKDLIVFCGGNNSGKTYMLNFLYGILKKEIHYTLNDSKFKDLIEKKSIILDLKEIWKAIILRFKQIKLLRLANFIGLEKLLTSFDFQIENNLFNLNKEEFENKLNLINFDLSLNGFELKAEFKDDARVQFDLIDYEIADMNHRKTILHFNLSNLILSCISPLQYFSLQFFTAERQSCLLFSHEIFKERFDNSVDPKAKKPLYNNYPKALLDELRFVNEFVENREKKSDFEYLAVELENLIGGKISSTQDGALKYKQNQSKAQLNMVAVSSTIKSLAGFIFYFRHIAEKGDCIIVDEPELSLHPDNQRKFARFLCRCVNEGFKVIISTHSDYIISEINNLITLHNHKDTPRTKAIMKKYGYKENQTLDYQRVGAYLFKERKNELIPTTKQGFSVETIDTEIDNLADASDDIANNFDNLEL